MCVYIAIIATILPVMLCSVGSAPVLKCNGCGLESYVARQFTLEVDAQYVNVRGSVHWKEVYKVRK